MGFRPAMELVEADGEVGVVVAQEPPGGSLVARSALVTLFIAAPAGREGAAAVAGDSARSEGAAGLHLGQPEADESVPAAASFAGADRAGGEVGFGDDVDPVGEAGGSRSALPSRQQGSGDGAGQVRGWRLARVRWLLVIGGWRVWWVEAAAAGALALLAAWTVAGTRALAGVLAAATVLVALVAWAVFAASRERRGAGAFADRSGRMLVDFDRQGRSS